MKFVFLMVSLLFSAGAFASSANVNPAQPIVMTSDFRSPSGEYVEAPWIRTNFTVDASETITLIGVNFTVSCRHGRTQMIHRSLLAGGVEVMGGSSYTLPLDYVYNLGHAGETQFSIHMDYEGWVGTVDEPIGRLHLSTDFVTQ